MVISIIHAEYIGEYSIRFSFSDGVEKTIDFSGFLKNARNSMTRKYLDKQLFKNIPLSMETLFGTITKCVSQFGIYTKELFKYYLLKRLSVTTAVFPFTATVSIIAF